MRASEVSVRKFGETVVFVLVLLSVITFGGLAYSPLFKWVQRIETIEAWCKVEHGGEIEGNVCVVGDTFRRTPGWLHLDQRP